MCWNSAVDHRELMEVLYRIQVFLGIISIPVYSYQVSYLSHIEFSELQELACHIIMCIQQQNFHIEVQYDIPCNLHLAVATFLLVLSHMISPPSKREAFIIESVRKKLFMNPSIASVILKYSTVTPGRAIYISPAVSPVDVTSWCPLGSITRRRTTSFSSQVNRRGSIKHTPLPAHLESLNVADADDAASVCKEV